MAAFWRCGCWLFDCPQKFSLAKGLHNAAPGHARTGNRRLILLSVWPGSGPESWTLNPDNPDLSRLVRFQG